VLPQAAHLARLHGLTVVENGLQAATQAGWLRRAIQSLLH
jgi:hypothetical protein